MRLIIYVLESTRSKDPLGRASEKGGVKRARINECMIYVKIQHIMIAQFM